MHTPKQVLKGIKLPSLNVAITGRVYNWLADMSDDIEPVSCWVLSTGDYKFNEFGQLFKDVGWKLQANAGVNIALDGIYDKLEVLKNLEPVKHQIFFTTTTAMNADTQSDFKFYLVADSLRLMSESSKSRFPNHISIFDSWVKLIEVYLNPEPQKVIFSFGDVREADDYSSGRGSFIEIMQKIYAFCQFPSLYKFLDIISTINGTIKRGGFRKHGAVTTSYNANDPGFDEYLNIAFGDLPYVKKSVDFADTRLPHFVTKKFNNIPSVLMLPKILEKYNLGEIFLEKSLGTNDSNVQIRSNVCRGIGLVPKDQCLIVHPNLGMVTDFKQIPKIYREATKFILEVYELQQSLGYKNVDRQIAVGVIGLANLLKIHQIKYATLIEALGMFNLANQKVDLNDSSIPPQYLKALTFIHYWFKGMKETARLARQSSMRASLTIEPSESCARRYKDCRGFDVTPNIDPPDVIPGIGVQHRHGTVLKDFNGQDMENVYTFGMDIETASELSHDLHFQLWSEVQKMMDVTKQAHMACYEHWNYGNEPLTIGRFMAWYKSPLKTLYYNRFIGTKHLSKGSNMLQAREYFKQTQNTATLTEEKTTQCPINEPCESCSD
jgi:hypothetical protein